MRFTFIIQPWAHVEFYLVHYFGTLGDSSPNISNGLWPTSFLSKRSRAQFIHVYQTAFGPIIHVQRPLAYLFMSTSLWPIHSCPTDFGPIIHLQWPLAHSFLSNGLWTIHAFISPGLRPNQLYPTAFGPTIWHSKHLSTIQINKLLGLVWK